MWGVTIANEHAFVSDTHNGVFVLNMRGPASAAIRRALDASAEGRRAIARFRWWVGPRRRPHLRRRWRKRPARTRCSRNRADTGRRRQDSQRRFLLPRPLETDATVSVLPHRRANLWRGLPWRQRDRRVRHIGSARVEHRPADSRRCRSIETTDRATDVCVAGERIYVAEGIGRAGRLPAWIPAADEEIGRYRVPDNTIRQVEVPGDAKFALVQVGVHKIQIVDVTNPDDLAKSWRISTWDCCTATS